jgi:hypothetical protein
MQIFIAEVVTVLAAVLIFYFIASPLQNCVRSTSSNNSFQCIAIMVDKGGSVIW